MEELFKSSWLGTGGLSFFTFLIGLIVGHRLNISRDKQNRLFELSKNIKKYYQAHKFDPSTLNNAIINKELDTYITYKSSLGCHHRRRARKLEKLCKDFESLQNNIYSKLSFDPEEPEKSSISETDEKKIKLLAEKILRLLHA